MMNATPAIVVSIPPEIIHLIQSYIDGGDHFKFFITKFVLISKDWFHVYCSFPCVCVKLKNSLVSLERMCTSRLMLGVVELDLYDCEYSSKELEHVFRCDNFTNLKRMNLLGNKLSFQLFEKVLARESFISRLSEFIMPRFTFSEKLVNILEQHAELSNNPLFYYLVGKQYYTIEKLKKSYGYLVEAAKGNYIPAMVDLGAEYEIHAEYDDAFEWFMKAAKLGDASAQYEIGKFYCDGKGVEMNVSKGFEWFLKSAQQGHVLSQNNVGEMYYLGWGIDQDYVQSFNWYFKSAQRGNDQAQFLLGEMYNQGTGVNQDFERAFVWFKKSAAQFNDHAQNRLGECYCYGAGVKQDYSKAFEMFTKSAKRNNTDAIVNVGHCHYYGRGTTRDYSLAMKNYQLVTSRKKKRAGVLFVGIMYCNGRGVDQNFGKALTYTLMATESSEHARIVASILYYFGLGVASDREFSCNHYLLHGIEEEDKQQESINIDDMPSINYCHSCKCQCKGFYHSCEECGFSQCKECHKGVETCHCGKSLSRTHFLSSFLPLFKHYAGNNVYDSELETLLTSLGSCYHE